MQLIHNVEDLGALEGHNIEAALSNQIASLKCDCGWGHAVSVEGAGGFRRAAEPGGVVEVLQRLADAGRDHLTDVLRERDG